MAMPIIMGSSQYSTPKNSVFYMRDAIELWETQPQLALLSATNAFVNADAASKSAWMFIVGMLSLVIGILADTMLVIFIFQGDAKLDYY